MSNVKMFEILAEAGVPAGAANLILGPGGSVGEALASHKDIGMVTLTGSTAVGQSIMRCAANNVKKIGLELGGKSPNIIFADVDLEAAVEWAMIGIFFNQGEVCCAGSRIIIEESIHDAFVKRFAERANAMTIGNPLDNPRHGPHGQRRPAQRRAGLCEEGHRRGRHPWSAAASATPRASAPKATSCAPPSLTTAPPI